MRDDLRAPHRTTHWKLPPAARQALVDAVARLVLRDLKDAPTVALRSEPENPGVDVVEHTSARTRPEPNIQGVELVSPTLREMMHAARDAWAEVMGT